MPVKKSTPNKKTLKINGKTFKLHSCKGAKTTAKKIRAAGYTARVIGGCVYKGAKSRVKRRKTTRRKRA